MVAWNSRVPKRTFPKPSGGSSRKESPTRSALPGSKPGSYLIEEVAIAQIPSARQLLPLPNRAASAGLLALGGLDYGKPAAEAKGWMALPGTALCVIARCLCQVQQTIL